MFFVDYLHILRYIVLLFDLLCFFFHLFLLLCPFRTLLHWQFVHLNFFKELFRSWLQFLMGWFHRLWHFNIRLSIWYSLFKSLLGCHIFLKGASSFDFFCISLMLGLFLSIQVDDWRQYFVNDHWGNYFWFLNWGRHHLRFLNVFLKILFFCFFLLFMRFFLSHFLIKYSRLSKLQLLPDIFFFFLWELLLTWLLNNRLRLSWLLQEKLFFLRPLLAFSFFDRRLLSNVCFFHVFIVVVVHFLFRLSVKIQTHSRLSSGFVLNIWLKLLSESLYFDFLFLRINLLHLIILF